MNSSLQTLLYGSPRSMTRESSWPKAALVGRVFLAAIFVMSGINKLMEPAATQQYMAAQGLPATGFLLFIAAVVEIVGGLSILTGTFARLGSLMLIAYLVVTTWVFHDFWALEGAERQAQMIHFLKNLSILGGLFFLLSKGAGRYSIDTQIQKRIR